MSQPWVGAWEWLSPSDSYGGKTIFTERHFCYASAGEHPNDAEAVATIASPRHVRSVWRICGC